MSDKMRSENVVSYLKGALVSGAIEECQLLNMELEPLHEGFYSVQLPVQVGGEMIQMEVRMQRCVSRPGSGWAVNEEATLSEVVATCAVLGRLVQIPVITEKEGVADE